MNISENCVHLERIVTLCVYIAYFMPTLLIAINSYQFYMGNNTRDDESLLAELKCNAA